MDIQQRWLAEDAISRVVFGYATGIDSGNLNDTAHLFSHGAWFVNPDQPFRGFDEVADFLWTNVILYDGVPRTRHCISNLVIDLEENGLKATARSNVMVYQAVPSQVPGIIFQGGYRDSFHVVDGQWFFDERHIVTDGIGDFSYHLKSANKAGGSRI